MAFAASRSGEREETGRAARPQRSDLERDGDRAACDRSGGWPQRAAVNPMPHSSELVERTADAKAAPVEHVGVHHGGRHVGMTQQFLDRANVVAGTKQFGRK